MGTTWYVAFFKISSLGVPYLICSTHIYSPSSFLKARAKQLWLGSSLKLQKTSLSHYLPAPVTSTNSEHISPLPTTFVRLEDKQQCLSMRFIASPSFNRMHYYLQWKMVRFISSLRRLKILHSTATTPYCLAAR